MVKNETRWDIEPLIGAGPLKLGMTREDVAQFEDLMGPLDAADEGPDDTVLEYRDLGWPVCGFRNGRLMSIDFDWRCNYIFIDGLDVFRIQSILLLQVLEKKNGRALYGLGHVLFDAISINTSGFFIRELSDGKEYFWEDTSDESIIRGLSVASKNAYAPNTKYYDPISFLGI